MRRQIVLVGLVAFGALSLAVGAQAPKPAASAVKVMKLTDNLFVLNALAGGGGGNTSVFITATGVVVVDTKNPGWGQPLLEVIKTLTPKPVTLIINTHTHGDHVSGNVEFPPTVDVVTHENTKTNMMAMRPAAFVAQPAGGPPPNIFTRNNGTGMPKRTFKDSMTIGRATNGSSCITSDARTPTATRWCSFRWPASSTWPTCFRPRGCRAWTPTTAARVWATPTR